MSLPGYDAWLEPDDEHVDEREFDTSDCKDGCSIEDEHDQPEQCMDAEDWREQMALERWEQERDDRG